MQSPEAQVQKGDVQNPGSNANVSPELGAQLLSTKEAMQILQANNQVYDRNEDRKNPKTGAQTETVSADSKTPGALDLTDPYGNVTVLRPDGTGSSIDKDGKPGDNFTWQKSADNKSVELDYGNGDKETFNSDGSTKYDSPTIGKSSTDASGVETDDPDNPTVGTFSAKFKVKENKDGSTEVSDGKNKFEFNKDGTGSIKGEQNSDFTYTRTPDGGYQMTMNDQSVYKGVNLDLKDGNETQSLPKVEINMIIPGGQ